MKKNNLRLVPSALIAAGLVFPLSVLAQSPPAAVGTGPAETSPEAPDTSSPFSPITSTGDPFGAISTSAIPTALMPSAGGVQMGPVSVYPVLGIALRYDDNMFLSNTNKRSAWSTIVSPGVRAEMRAPGGSTYGVTYRADLADVSHSNADRYTDQAVVADANIVITTAARMSIRLEYLDLHDPRGSTDRAIAPRPDMWHAPGASAMFSYGTPGSRGRVEVEGGTQAKRYENNRATTIAADRDNTFYGGTFYWRFMPKTSLLVGARQTDIDYQLDTSTQDSTERRYYAGVTWEATAKTTGIVKIGTLKKDFDSAARQDFSGTSWEGKVRWSPLTYSVVEVTTSKETNEGSGVGDYILSSLVYGTWTHAWNSRLKSNTLLGFRKDDFQGAGATRQDETLSVGAGVSYQMRRWFNLGTQYIYTDRSSNSPANEYQRNVIMFTLGATL